MSMLDLSCQPSTVVKFILDRSVVACKGSKNHNFNFRKIKSWWLIKKCLLNSLQSKIQDYNEIPVSVMQKRLYSIS